MNDIVTVHNHISFVHLYELGTNFYLQLYLTHDLLPEYERCSYVGSMKFFCVFVLQLIVGMKWNESISMMESSWKKDGQPL